MSRPFDPEHPEKFSASLVAGLAMLTCFIPEHTACGIAEALNWVCTRKPMYDEYRHIDLAATA
jgi:hypothetical protein